MQTGRLFSECMADPLHGSALHADHVEAAGGGAPFKMPARELGKKIVGGAQQAALLGAVYTGGSPAMARRAALAHFHKHQHVAFARGKVDFTGPAQQVALENQQTLAFEPLGGALLKEVARGLGG